MIRLVKISILIFAAACLACSNNKQIKETIPVDIPITAGFDNAFQLKFDQTAVIAPENLSIKFTNVAEDSRCPENVECVWQGQAKIEVEISKNDKNLGEFNLTSLKGHDELARKDINNYEIKLLKVGPLRKDRELVLSDYVITLLITQK